MTDLGYLFTAFAFVWIGVLIYLMRIAALRKQLEARIDTIEQRIAREDRIHD